MDDKRFDEIAKAIGVIKTRRAAIRAVGAGIFGAVSGLAGLVSDTEAGTKRKRRLGAQATTTPTVIPGNPTCESVGSTGFKVDPPVSGERTVPGEGGCKCTVKYTVSGDGKRLSFTSNCYIKTVLVKGGPAANRYDYPGLGTFSDSGLVAPINNGGQLPQISHFNFCGLTCCTPKTCADFPGECGEIPDNCNGTLRCGCDDGNKCTEDRCKIPEGSKRGTCVYTPVKCDRCFECKDGKCVPQPKDTPCDDGNKCTRNDVCDGNGVCKGTPVKCDRCYECKDGKCVPQPKDTPCDDGNKCTTNDVCDGNGVCKGTPVTCPPCHECKDGICSGGCPTGQCCQGGRCQAPKTCDDLGCGSHPDNGCGTPINCPCVCNHSSGSGPGINTGGCKGACTASGCTGGVCEDACRDQAGCEVGQGGGNPCDCTAACVKASWTCTNNVPKFKGCRA